MLLKRLLGIVVLSSLAFGFAAEASAGEIFHRKRGKVVACYSKLRSPGQYELAARKVLMSPGWTETRVEPAVYEQRLERVLVSPARTVWVAKDPVYRTVTEHVVVRAAYRKWRTVVDEGGNETRYEIIVPAVTRAVERRVLVSDGGKVAVRQAAVYRTLSKPRLVRGERTRVIRHKPVYRTVYERVLVRSGGGRWTRGC